MRDWGETYSSFGPARLRLYTQAVRGGTGGGCREERPADLRGAVSWYENRARAARRPGAAAQGLISIASVHSSKACPSI